MSTMVTINKITIVVLLVTFAGGLPFLNFISAKTEGDLKETAKPEKIEERTDAQGSNEEEELQLGEEVQATLKEIRKFWKREEITRIEKVEFPSFRVPSRSEELEFYPCMDCHEDDKINDRRVRELTEEHQSIVLDHGGKRFWCLTCHNLRNMNYFRSMKEEQIDFDRPYLLCGQCHSPRQEDWYFGGHGKRIGSWNGAKVVLSCTECHNPHSPSIKPKPPDPPPKHHKGPDNFLTNLKKLKIWQTLGIKAND